MVQLSPAQLSNATTIINVGRSMGMSDQDIKIALMTALTESSLLMYANSTVPESLQYPHDAVGHDTDSLGLFQQRPSANWGTVATLMTATGDAQAFYRALSKVGGRLVMPPGQVAQRVQVSAFPDRYQTHWADAQTIFASITGSKGSGSDYMGATTTSAPAGSVAAANPGLFGSLTTITTDLSSAEWWRRVGLFAAGAVMVLIAVLTIVSQSGAVKAAGKVAVKAGELAAL